MDYKKAGVDIEAGYKSVELMKKHVKETMRAEVLGGLGGFSGAFSLNKIKEMEDPVLLSGTDGCGTKVKLAFLMDKHDTIGIDAVAMCVNDIACAGGEPLFFLDYIACGKNYPEKIAEIVKGVAEGCKQSGAALIGGETAEHPGLMPEDEYDLAGFAVGVVDRKDMITGSELKDGDRVIMIEDVTTSGKSMEETVPKVKGAADVEIVGLMVSLNRMEIGKGGEKCALDEIKELYGFDTAAIVDMDEVVECLYNKECNGKVVIDDTLKAAIDAYYEQYGAKH